MCGKQVDSYRNSFSSSLRRSWSAPSAPLYHILGRKPKPSVFNSAKKDLKPSIFHAVKAANNPRIRISRFSILFPAIGGRGRCNGNNANVMRGSEGDSNHNDIGIQQACGFPSSKTNGLTTSRTASQISCRDNEKEEAPPITTISSFPPSSVLPLENGKVNKEEIDDEIESSYDALKAQLEAATSQIHLLSSANEQTLKRYNTLEKEHQQLCEINESLKIENELLKRELVIKESEIDEQLHLTCELQRELEKVREIAMNGE